MQLCSIHEITDDFQELVNKITIQPNGKKFYLYFENKELLDCEGNPIGSKSLNGAKGKKLEILEQLYSGTKTFYISYNGRNNPNIYKTENRQFQFDTDLKEMIIHDTGFILCPSPDCNCDLPFHIEYYETKICIDCHRQITSKPA